MLIGILSPSCGAGCKYEILYFFGMKHSLEIENSIHKFMVSRQKLLTKATSGRVGRTMVFQLAERGTVVTMLDLRLMQ